MPHVRTRSPRAVCAGLALDASRSSRWSPAVAYTGHDESSNMAIVAIKHCRRHRATGARGLLRRVRAAPAAARCSSCSMVIDSRVLVWSAVLGRRVEEANTSCTHASRPSPVNHMCHEGTGDKGG